MKKFYLFFISLCLGYVSIAQDFDGFALYNALNDNTTFLIDKDGNIAHRWNCDLRGNYTVLLKENGNIIRGAVYAQNEITGAAVGGIVQELDKDANVVWEFIYSSEDYVQHHDLTLMPNGGVLLTAWEVKSAAELQALGYVGNSEKYPTHFIEVRQKAGTTEGEIVWEWHMIDHMIQDDDPSKPSYGSIVDNPQLMDINVSTSGRTGGPGGGGDWFHVNGVDYNPELDLITFSSRYLSEIFVIDHSTTTAEAATHEGGNSGMGGDLLYRWGNPNNWGMTGNKRIHGACHDARYIPNDGRFRAGYIQFFNNEGVDGSGSTVVAFDPPFNGKTFDREPGKAFGPEIEEFSHDTRIDGDGQSASDALPNGNTFVNVSRGYMYEVDADDNLVWQYPEGPAKAFRYTCDYSGITALLGADACGTSSTDDYLVEKDLTIFPNPSTGFFNISGLSGVHKVLNIEITTPFGGKIAVLSGNPNSIDLSDQPAGQYFVTFNFDNQKSQTKLISLVK